MTAEYMSKVDLLWIMMPIIVALLSGTLCISVITLFYFDRRIKSIRHKIRVLTARQP